ncbi:MAG: hypothetical protein ACK42I_01015 [Thermomicrobium sp.]
MARIVITIEGDSQEIGAIQEVLQRLAGLAAGELEVSELSRVPSEREAWTFEEFRQFWSRLQDGARQILAEIAKRPEGYPMVELERALGVPARVIGGRLSSVGHAMRRFPHKEEPVEFRTGGDEAPGRRIYFMKPEIARMIRRLTSEGAAEEAADF